MSYHSYPTLSSLAQDHWTHRIQAPLTYLQSSYNYPTSIPSYISTQRTRSTRSSSVVTLARPPSSSSLKITDRSFRYASPCFWNQLPLSLRKPHSCTSSSISCSPNSFTHHFLLFWFTTMYIYNSISLSLPAWNLHLSQILPFSFTSFSRTASTDFCLHRFFWATRFFIFIFFHYFSFLGRALD